VSRQCKISKKANQHGNTVSHANNRNRTIWNPNLKKKWIFDSTSGKWAHLRVSTRILRTIDKKGLAATLKDYGMTIADCS
jgi:large subunit ribosomal protein L28